MTLTFEQLIERLRGQGYRITTPRRWTLKVLAEEGGHLTSEEVHQKLMAHEISVDAATVYRTLQWLADSRIVTRTNLGLGADVYSLYSEPHHHLICIQCHAISELDDHMFEALRERIQTEYDFAAQMDHFAVFGVCRECRNKR